MEKRTIYRSAKTGRLVTEQHAMDHPDTTTQEHVTLPSKLECKSSRGIVENLLWLLDKGKEGAYLTPELRQKRENDIELLKTIL